MDVRAYVKEVVSNYRKLLEVVEVGIQRDPHIGPEGDLPGPLSEALKRFRTLPRRRVDEDDPDVHWREAFRLEDALHSGFHQVVMLDMITGRIRDHEEKGLGFPARLRPTVPVEPVVDLKELKSKVRRMHGGEHRGDGALNLAQELVEAAENGELPEPLVPEYDSPWGDEAEPTAPLILLEPYIACPDAAVVEDEHRWGLVTSRWHRKGGDVATVEIRRMKPPLTWAEVLIITSSA